ncbi:MAG: efflux transporter periplasmic adaptor subunit, partial [bacterium]|nr:efflux transporter periplasmic adaptor subunit [bacterium]
EETVPNPQFKLKPGMFTHVSFDASKPQDFLTIPQSAISFNPYGDIVFVIKNSGKKDAKNKAILIANEVFVTVGDSRGDQVAIIKGLQSGEMIVTSGQLKLKNGSPVVINNKVQPSNDAAPKALEK